MNIKKLLFPLLLVCSVVAFIYRTFYKSASLKPASNSDLYDEIDAYIERQRRRLKMPGISLAIVDSDRIAHLRGFGRARPNGEAPIPQTPFFVGSLTKSFTALAVMQLVEAGKIDLDAPVQRYLPWFRVSDSQASTQITVRHLLNQTSGLPTSSGEIPLADFDNSPGATEHQARALATLKLTRPVGSAFEYSNANYNLLGLIIEVASGESYADYVQKHIFNPLGMGHSYTSKEEAARNGLAVGHQYWFVHPVAAPSMPIPYGSFPGGLLISSTEDLARYMIALLNGGRYGDVQILSAAGIDELQRGAVDVSYMGYSLGRYGMGWYVGKIGRTKLVWHSGILPDFYGYMALLPEQKKGLALLFNADHHWMSPVLTMFGADVTALLAGEQPQPAPIPFMGMIPWMLRGQLLIPIFQIADVAVTLSLLRLWRLYPERRPSGGRQLGLYVVGPLIPNLLTAFTIKSLLSKRRGYLKLYMPDYAWIAMVCGSFGLVWSFLRAGLVLRALEKPHCPTPPLDGSIPDQGPSSYIT